TDDSRGSRRGRHLPGPATQRRCRPDLVAADCDCHLARPNCSQSSRRETITQSSARIHHQRNHNIGADCLCNFALTPTADAPRISIAVAPVWRATLANECDRVRFVVLAPGWRRADLAPKTTQIRQQEFSFSTNANYTRRATRICVCPLASAFC